MKKSFKFISLLFVSLIMVLVGRENVFASDTAPESFVAKSYALSPKPIGLTNNISVKKTSDGKYIYCFDVNKSVPNNVTYTKKEMITDPAIRYIINSGVTGDKVDNDFFATQAALWIYLLDNGKMSDTEYNYIANIKKAINSNTYKDYYMSQDIRNLVANAYKFTGATPSFEVSGNISFTLVGNRYVSNHITVTTNISNWDVTFNGAPTGTTYEKDATGFVVYVPMTSIVEGATVNFTVNVATDAQKIYHVYRYVANTAGYQDMLYSGYETKTFSDSLDASISRPKTYVPEPVVENTSISISKKDITNSEELPGATLIVRDSKGREIDKWVSTNEVHKMKKLAVGTYTLEEISAPEGYEKSSEIITFTVKQDGKTSVVTMFNSPKEVTETVVVISKKNVTNGEELPGATLIVKDSKGREIDKWVSGNEPHIIKGLDDGVYTLSEITSPDGFILNKEEITFEVKNNGVVTEVVMYNTPKSTEIIVPQTGVNASTVAYVLGVLVIAIGSVLLVRNAKKEQ